ncbi:hypothetical protein KC19_11G055800 [Ceratodon purpureus]|uniref:Uncharacterized protein n=1 Tax=Ceratodon purpureus TaxID=3225 RepID=A0A8T0GBQ7_CERPU|nr:hypothetical protein KC19_11G055800 [Ceratodon purpureus]
MAHTVPGRGRDYESTSAVASAPHCGQLHISTALVDLRASDTRVRHMIVVS